MSRDSNPEAPCSRCGRKRVVNQSRTSDLCRACRLIQGPIGDRSWMPSGKCAGTQDPVFFDDDAIKRGDYMRWCGPCPVRLECLAYAISNDEAHGIWGGTTPNARRQMVVQSLRRRARRLSQTQTNNEGER